MSSTPVVYGGLAAVGGAAIWVLDAVGTSGEPEVPVKFVCPVICYEKIAGCDFFP